jgi:hypothetical protein
VEGSAPSGVGNQEQNVVEGSDPSETEEDPASSVSVIRAGNVRAPATIGNFAPPVGKKKKQLWMTVVPQNLQAP